MTALVLVVDDLPPNVKLLEAKLVNEYYDVVTARDGYEAIQRTKESKPDLILLDVMMPGMDGFEACQKLKQDPEVSHIPVVMVTALNETADRVKGLESGADDFLTKPINDTALFARVRSLVRMKVLIDELRLRDRTGLQMGLMSDAHRLASEVEGAKILAIDDDRVQLSRIQQVLQPLYSVDLSDPAEAMDKAIQGNYDLLIISTQMDEVDGLRLASHLKSHERTRHIPVLMLVDDDDQQRLLKGLEMGINDYLLIPIDPNEMSARVKTQIRRKKFQDALKSNYQQSLSLAITDKLTKLYNRHYLDTHLGNMVEQSVAKNKPLSLLILDMDHFKSVNDTYGHTVGDEVLQQLAGMILGSIRSADLAARYGGEEFVVLMPETDKEGALDVAERVRKTVEESPFKISHQVGELKKTVSIGVATLEPGEVAAHLLERADQRLYKAKNSGRNKVEQG